MANMADKKRDEAITAYVFMAPALLVFLFFLIIPIGFAVYISFTNWNGITPLAQQSALARGDVTFTNLTTDTITVPAGTRISNGNPENLRVYQTDADLTLAPNATDDISVSAIEAGRSSNVRRRQLDTIEDANLAALVSVENADNIENGLDQAFQFVGVENYSRLLFEPGIRQSDFFLSLKNTVYFVLGVVPVQTLLSLLLATVVNQRWLRGKGLFRTAFYFPSITSSVVISIIFMWMFTQSGLINTIIQGIFPNYQAVNWLEDPNGVIHNLLGVFGVNRGNVGDWARSEVAGLTLWEWISGPSVTMLTIMILNTWTTIGTMMVIYLAALQNIPGSVYEAASIDGATGWQQFRLITVPLLTATTFFVVTLGLIGTFQVFDQIFVISSGGRPKPP